MAQIEKFEYDNTIVRNFAVASIIFGIVALSVGLWIALELVYPSLNLGISWNSFGRLRPLHTNSAIFAFVGNAIFAGVYYSTQRLLKARMYSPILSQIHFWGWQLVILAAAITLPLGITGSHEYAELEWPIDLLITVAWVAFGANMIGTMIKRRESHFYVAIWFYVSTFITVAVLHIGNNLEVPVTFWKSYPVFAGVQDALLQWWYGHNAVAFFLTTPYLGLMYYYLPKAANRPVYSYRLSIIHFWSLIFIYIWAGPHHLLYSSLPDWTQSVGTVFSIMLIAPSWGGMLNGLLTLRGAWDRVREDPILKFMVVAVTAYGMSTFEGPMLSIKSVNAIAHFTDWIPAHVHVGTLGWNGFMTFGMFYWMFPRLYNTTLFSKKLANIHFWIGTLGILFWVVPMYFAGWTQSMEWKEFTPEGTLVYGKFVETLKDIKPMLALRAFGGTLYLTGALIGFYNLMKTALQGKLIANEAAEAPALVIHDNPNESFHRKLERKPVPLLIWATVAILVGGAVEFFPMTFMKSSVPKIEAVKPYTALELQGRDIYIREGCVSCHSQQVRPFRSETVRYGEYSKAGEYIYDRPFLWGSKRTGPDLHRIGGRYSDDWHYNHMLNPLETEPESIMPAYPWLFTDDLDNSSLPAKIRVLQKLGTPYPEGYDQQALADLEVQALKFAKSIASKVDGVNVDELKTKEIIAITAYLQRLGTDIKAK